MEHLFTTEYYGSDGQRSSPAQFWRGVEVNDGYILNSIYAFEPLKHLPNIKCRMYTP